MSTENKNAAAAATATAHANKQDEQGSAPAQPIGPSEESTRRSKLFPSENVAVKLANVSIARMPDQKQVLCKELWTKELGGHDGPVLLVLMRRFGCAVCQMCCMNLSALKPYFDAKNVKMVGVSCTDAEYEKFVKDNYLQGADLFVDVPLATYKAVGASTFLGQLFTSPAASVREFSSVFKMTKKNGYENSYTSNWNQQGGYFVIAPNGERTLFSHLQHTSAFFPDMRKLMMSIGYTDEDMPKDLYPAQNLNLSCLKKDVCGMK